MPDEDCVLLSGEKKSIYEVLNIDRDYLIFRFSSFNCTSCAKSVLKQLSNLLNDTSIVIISDFKNISAMRFIRDEYKFKNAIFLKVNDIDIINTPSVYQISKERKIIKFLYIHPKDKVLTHYLKQYIMD